VRYTDDRYELSDQLVKTMDYLAGDYSRKSSAWVHDDFDSAVRDTWTVLRSISDFYKWPKLLTAWQPQTAYKILCVGLEYAGRKFYQNNRNLPNAIESGHEILFYETQGYYSVPLELLKNHMKESGRIFDSAEYPGNLHRYFIEMIQS
jgi:hypothetical protein